MTDDGSSSSHLAVVAAFIGNGLIAVSKGVLALATGSAAMAAEFFHSLADTTNQALLLYGLSCARKPPDDAHPFGYGKERYFWTFVVALLIFVIGSCYSVYRGISTILHPHSLHNLTSSYLVLALAFVIESVPLTIAYRAFQRRRTHRSLFQSIRHSKDSALFTVLFEDSAAMLGIIIAATGLLVSELTGNFIYDGLASVLIGLLLAAVATFVGFESKQLLIGEGVTQRNKARIRAAIDRHPKVIRSMELLTMHLAPNEVLINTNVHFVDDLTTDELEQITDELEQAIRQVVPIATQIFIEPDGDPPRADRPA